MTRHYRLSLNHILVILIDTLILAFINEVVGCRHSDYGSQHRHTLFYNNIAIQTQNITVITFFNETSFSSKIPEQPSPPHVLAGEAPRHPLRVYGPPGTTAVECVMDIGYSFQTMVDARHGGSEHPCPKRSHFSVEHGIQVYQLFFHPHMVMFLTPGKYLR